MLQQLRRRWPFVFASQHGPWLRQFAYLATQA
jgi:hypothetical protein